MAMIEMMNNESFVVLSFNHRPCHASSNASLRRGCLGSWRHCLPPVDLRSTRAYTWTVESLRISHCRLLRGLVERPNPLLTIFRTLQNHSKTMFLSTRNSVENVKEGFAWSSPANMDLDTSRPLLFAQSKHCNRQFEETLRTSQTHADAHRPG